MSGILAISEATSLALHATAVLASRPDRVVSARDLARTLRASEAHLAKVFQRLVAAGIVRSSRGPRGGFSLRREPASTTLREVYEAVAGPLPNDRCLRPGPACDGGCCLLGDLLATVNRDVARYFDRTTLADVARRNGGGLGAVAEGEGVAPAETGRGRSGGGGRAGRTTKRRR